ncbi:hypothetical protein PFLA_a0083 [Pseudoalteromonas flavipulchra NCIMB 2033 = ATCC BAA-314]|nr:hypothetical protein [Pseudoalteromonas flavipulchra NCIMB 2033 = ATCC BAA-314]
MLHNRFLEALTFLASVISLASVIKLSLHCSALIMYSLHLNLP